MTPTAKRSRGSTRHNMLVSAAEVMRERGAAGVTIDEVLARSGAPRGSVYHHFPEGRNQILAEALRCAGDAITAGIDAAAEKGAGYLVGEFVDFWERLLTDSDFAAGCPVVAAAIGWTQEEPQLTAVASDIFGRWRDALAGAFAPTASTPPRPSHWRSPASPRWRAPWCCAAPPAPSNRCATSPLKWSS